MAGCHPHKVTAVLMLQPTDASLSTADQQERLSVAYVLALAAKAGYTTSQYDLDRIGIDVDVHSEERMQPASLSLQLKATRRLYRLRDGSGFSFELEADTYNRLRHPKVQVPRLLAVLDMPDDEDEWLTVTVEGLMLRRRMYWLNLYGQPETMQSSETVRIPVLQILDVEALRQLMDDSRHGRL